MELNTYTSLWNVERKLYKLYDWTLPVPVGFRQLGVGGGFGLIWMVLLNKLGVPFGSPWHVLYLGPPGVGAWLAGKPVAEGKTLSSLVLSQLRYIARQPRHLTRLTATRAPETVLVVGEVWRAPSRRRLGPASTGRPA